MGSFGRVLLIDTSGKTGLLALAEAGRVIESRLLSEARRHVRDLTLRTQEMLKNCDWSPTDLSAVVVSIGPGSYTGLRVGIASAKALAYATQCALFAVPTFDAIAHGVSAGDFDLTIVTDALQGMIYAGNYRWLPNEGWVVSVPIALVTAREWAGGLQPAMRIAGPGLSVVRPLLRSNVIPLDTASDATPASLLGTAQARPDLHRTTAWEIAPIYLRGSSAEEKRKRAAERVGLQ
jgi:tRNA threonylcarbamoyladenosine biosynthesis protein TsaB